MTTTKPQQQQGFTLIEVLVALIIIAMVGISAQTRISQFLDDRIRIIDKQEAQAVAWNQLMVQYQIANGLEGRGDSRPEKRSKLEFMGREWHYITEREATVSKGFFRYQTQVGEQSFSSVDLEGRNKSTANLVMFLVNN